MGLFRKKKPNYADPNCPICKGTGKYWFGVGTNFTTCRCIQENIDRIIAQRQRRAQGY